MQAALLDTVSTLHGEQLHLPDASLVLTLFFIPSRTAL